MNVPARVYDNGSTTGYQTTRAVLFLPLPVLFAIFPAVIVFALMQSKLDLQHTYDRDRSRD